jgi:hypothetical protein
MPSERDRHVHSCVGGSEQFRKRYAATISSSAPTRTTSRTWPRLLHAVSRLTGSDARELERALARVTERVTPARS